MASKELLKSVTSSSEVLHPGHRLRAPTALAAPLQALGLPKLPEL